MHEGLEEALTSIVLGVHDAISDKPIVEICILTHHGMVALHWWLTCVLSLDVRYFIVEYTVSLGWVIAALNVVDIYAFLKVWPMCLSAIQWVQPANVGKVRYLSPFVLVCHLHLLLYYIIIILIYIWLLLILLVHLDAPKRIYINEPFQTRSSFVCAVVCWLNIRRRSALCCDVDIVDYVYVRLS